MKTNEAIKSIKESLSNFLDFYESECYVDYNSSFEQFWEQREYFFDTLSKEEKQKMSQKEINDFIDVNIASEILCNNFVFAPDFDNLKDDLDFSQLSEKQILELKEEFDNKVNNIFNDFVKNAKNSAGEKLIGISINERGGFQEGQSEIAFNKEGEVGSVVVDDAFYSLLNQLNIYPKDFYDFIVKKDGDDVIQDKEGFINPDLYLKNTVYNLAQDDTQDDKEKKMQQLYETLECGATNLEAVVLINMSLDDYLELDFSKPLNIKKAVIGLIDYHSGSGDFLEQQDIIFNNPKACAKIDGDYGYSVEEIFGINKEYFNGRITPFEENIDCPPSLR